MTFRNLIAHWYVWPWFPLIGLALFWWLDWEIALPIYLIASGWSILEFVAWWRAALQPVRSGPESLIGQIAQVTQTQDDDMGWVSLRGELWRARFQDAVGAGETVIVEDVQRTLLIVRKRYP